jgi:hypothetical protein
VSQFKYFGTTVTNQNLIQEEIKRRLNSGNAYYHSVQNLLSSLLVSKNMEKMNAYGLLLGRPRHRWVDIIKMDLGEVGLGGGGY